MSWEDKLNRINALFDVWIDVQRRWVYLEGIFTGSADIKHLLPVETSRFQRCGFDTNDDLMCVSRVDCFAVIVINVLIKRGVRLVVWTLCWLMVAASAQNSLD